MHQLPASELVSDGPGVAQWDVPQWDVPQRDVPQCAAANVYAGQQARGAAMRHQAAIQAFAEEIDRPASEIASVYQRELASLAARARVADFLPVLVMKRVRKLYKNRLDSLRHTDCTARGAANAD